MLKDNDLPASFVGKTGHFYIRQRRADGGGFHHRVTVWPCVDDYNQRKSVAIAFCDAVDALADFDREVKIYPESLTTTPPPYDRDKDETDLGLTPIQNFWSDQFNRAMEGHHHEA